MHTPESNLFKNDLNKVHTHTQPFSFYLDLKGVCTLFALHFHIKITAFGDLAQFKVPHAFKMTSNDLSYNSSPIISQPLAAEGSLRPARTTPSPSEARRGVVRAGLKKRLSKTFFFHGRDPWSFLPISKNKKHFYLPLTTYSALLQGHLRSSSSFNAILMQIKHNTQYRFFY